jgi:RHH-type proline utilization regulon transcriptional repressor/proline dehydrogenase/delta 1-pyrroline-5-carboxylate dehydrogenase
MSTEYALLVTVTDRPELKTIIQVLSCMMAGTGLSVACRNKASYKWWQGVRDALFLAGFSKENIEVYFSKSSDLQKIINHPKLSVIIYDGNLEDYGAHVAQYLDDGKNDQRMKLILTTADNLHSTDFYHQTLNYIWVRSLAVNTMRHGAPLDLEI